MLEPYNVRSNHYYALACASPTSADPSIPLMRNNDGGLLRRIGAGACGTVWTSSSSEESSIAYKREDGGTSRSLSNDFTMHRRLLDSVLGCLPQPSRIQVPECHRFITSSDLWWDENSYRFPVGYLPCNLIQAQRIPPISQRARLTLIERYCPVSLREEILSSAENRDCLIRPYLGRRRVLANASRRMKFQAFSLRNYPLHLDQMEELGIPLDHLELYARSMAETLAVMHWGAGIDGNDIEFVLGSPSPAPSTRSIVRSENILGTHVVWVLDFDLCREMPMNEEGVQQAVTAFYKNDPFYPRPLSSPSLWKVFREQYLLSSVEVIVDAPNKDKRAFLSRRFIETIEKREAASESHV